MTSLILYSHNRGMLPDAVLPPTEDHTYAQWLEREETLVSPQLSPFKRLPFSPGTGIHGW